MSRLEFMKGFLRTLRQDLLADKLELNIQEKTSHSDIVTEYDQKIENAICDAISAKFPEDVFFTEEESHHNEKGKHMWIIDPIDGTANFAAARFGYAIAVAYYEDYVPTLGFVYDVAQDILYTGIRGEGAFKNDKKLPVLPKEYNLKDMLFDVSFPAINRFKHHNNLDFYKVEHEFLGHRAFGSAALALCYVAEGRLGFFSSSKLAIWDYAASQVILEELGGYCKNLDIDDFPIDTQARPFFAAQSEDIYKDVMRKIKI